jgi:hypothetical protein
LIRYRDIFLKLLGKLADHLYLTVTEETAVLRQPLAVIDAPEVADIDPGIGVYHPGNSDFQTTVILFYPNTFLFDGAQYLLGKLGMGPYVYIPGLAIDGFSSFLYRLHFFG